MDRPDVLIVGAGPTGLSLAAALHRHGIRPRIVDRALDRVHESRALAIQPRTLEVLDVPGVTERLVAAGSRTVRLRMHVPGRVLTVPLFDLGLHDTAYPYLLFLSQAETERVLDEHLRTVGITVQRGVEFVGLEQDGEAVSATLRHGDGRAERLLAGYVVGCDGAHSAVRTAAGIEFAGSSYPQTFVLADVEADGIEPGAAHVFLAGTGMLFFFPLGKPATWRVLAMRPRTDPTPPDAAVTLDQVQALVDTGTTGHDAVRLHDPVWMTNFRLHHRAATRYRTGRVFLAGDAAHIHSPAGAQGMNTGIQDAHNLAWKLAHTLRGTGGIGLLDTYQPERAPVGAMVLRFSDRAYKVATSTNPVLRFARTRLAPLLLPLALRYRTGRAYAFRAVSQLAIRYRRSPLSVDGPRAARRGPRAGERLPDADIIHNGQPYRLHAAVAGPGWHLLLCGPPAWPAEEVARIGERYGGLLSVHHLTTGTGDADLHDPDGEALHRLGLNPSDHAQYLVRPDGHVGFRNGGTDLADLTRYLNHWLTP